jgi:hypothetical protein
LSQETAAACYACKLLYEEGETACSACGASLTPLGTEGNFIQPTDTGGARDYWQECLFEDTLRKRFWEREHPKPPFPTDSSPAIPSWKPVTAQSRAYEAWFTDMFATWHENKARALADEALVARVQAEIDPIVEQRVSALMYANRKYKCPSCGEIALGFHAIPHPR